MLVTELSFLLLWSQEFDELIIEFVMFFLEDSFTKMPIFYLINKADAKMLGFADNLILLLHQM